jgi:hypothetical protein
MYIEASFRRGKGKSKKKTFAEEGVKAQEMLKT